MGRLVILIVVVLVLIPAALFSGCLFGVVTGSGKLATEETDFTDFSRVEVSDAFEIEIIQSSSYSVSITADDNVFDFIQVSKSDQTLKLGLKPAYGYQSVTLRAKITMPNLHGLHLSGASQGTVTGFSSPYDFELGLSGASSVEIANMSAGDIDFVLSGASQVSGDILAVDAQLDLSGASRIEMKGSANNVLIEASGASELELADFVVRNLDINLSGGSQAKVNLDGQLDATVGSGSQLLYTGEPTLGKIDISGGSTMRKE